MNQQTPIGILAFQEEMLLNLQLGRLTDCVFHVGANDNDAEEVYAVKSIMMMGSEYMRSIFGNEWNEGNPVRIRFDAKSFKLLVKFSHACHMWADFTCDELACLLVATDYFMFAHLKNACIELLEKSISVDSVWTVLNKLLENPDLLDDVKTCTKMVKENTAECLEHASFGSASKTSIIFLLQQESLNLRNEHELVQHCIDWALQQPEGIVTIRAVLPHLRLLTLRPEEVARLPDFFEGKELGFVLKNTIINDELPNKEECPLINCDREPRNFAAGAGLSSLETIDPRENEDVDSLTDGSNY